MCNYFHETFTGNIFIFKKVFIREIVSNSSDALEKLRHLQVLGNDIVDPDLPLEIHLTTDEEKGLFIIQDFGIGLKKEELVNCTFRVQGIY